MERQIPAVTFLRGLLSIIAGLQLPIRQRLYPLAKQNTSSRQTAVLGYACAVYGEDLDRALLVWISTSSIQKLIRSEYWLHRQKFQADIELNKKYPNLLSDIVLIYYFVPAL